MRPLLLDAGHGIVAPDGLHGVEGAGMFGEEGTRSSVEVVEPGLQFDRLRVEPRRVEPGEQAFGSPDVVDPQGKAQLLLDRFRLAPQVGAALDGAEPLAHLGQGLDAEEARHFGLAGGIGRAGRSDRRTALARGRKVALSLAARVLVLGRLPDPPADLVVEIHGADPVDGKAQGSGEVRDVGRESVLILLHGRDAIGEVALGLQHGGEFREDLQHFADRVDGGDGTIPTEPASGAGGGPSRRPARVGTPCLGQSSLAVLDGTLPLLQGGPQGLDAGTAIETGLRVGHQAIEARFRVVRNAGLPQSLGDPVARRPRIGLGMGQVALGLPHGRLGHEGLPPSCHPGAELRRVEIGREWRHERSQSSLDLPRDVLQLVLGHRLAFPGACQIDLDGSEGHAGLLKFRDIGGAPETRARDPVVVPQQIFEPVGRRRFERSAMLGPGALARGPDRGGLRLADDARDGAQRVDFGDQAPPLAAQAIGVGLLAVDAAPGLVPRLGEPLERPEIRQHEGTQLADIAGPGPKCCERPGQHLAQTRERAFGHDPARRMIAAAEGRHEAGKPRGVGADLAAAGLLQPVAGLGQCVPCGIAFALRAGDRRRDARAALQQRPHRAQRRRRERDVAGVGVRRYTEPGPTERRPRGQRPERRGASRADPCRP